MRHALELAGEGRDVALICSGDAGIYAMAALVYELLDEPAHGHPVSAAPARGSRRRAGHLGLPGRRRPRGRRHRP